MEGQRAMTIEEAQLTLQVWLDRRETVKANAAFASAQLALTRYQLAECEQNIVAAQAALNMAMKAKEVQDGGPGNEPPPAPDAGVSGAE